MTKKMPSDAQVRAAFRKLGQGKGRVPKASSFAGMRRLETALCVLADYEREIKAALCDSVGDGASDYDHAHVCAALRILLGE